MKHPKTTKQPVATLQLLIASLKAPTAETWDMFQQGVRELAKGTYPTITLGRMGVVDGPSCANIVIEVTANDKDFNEFADHITIALMPARWTTTKDEMIEGYHLTK